MASNNRRIPHIMKPHKTNKQPSNFVFFDTETISDPQCKIKRVERQILSFGWAYGFRMEGGKKTRESWCRFTTAESFFKWLIKRSDPSRPLWVFSHNLPFDLTIVDFWNWCSDENFRVEYFVLQSPPSFIIGRYKKSKLIFADTLNYWRQSAKAIGSSLGFNKLPMPTKRATVKTWDKYCRRDVEIIEKAVIGLMKYLIDNDLGQFGLSAASLSLSTYKHRFLTHDIFIHDNREVLELERASYLGGFTHCYYVGKLRGKRVYKLDVNSMYPFCMRNKFPCKWLEKLREPSPNIIRRWLQTDGAIANVRIRSNSRTYPTYLNGRLCYANGDFNTTLAGPELSDALSHNDIAYIHFAAHYDTAHLFRSYIDFFYAERQRYRREGNEVAQYFIKIFMNSLYGKFGQLGYDTAELTPCTLATIYENQGKVMPSQYNDPCNLLTEAIPEVSWKPLGLNRPLVVRRINNSVQVKIPVGEHGESFPAIAAYVTSYARVLLFKYIKICGPRQVYYCDTDSIFCTEEGYNNLRDCGYLHDTELGMLKLEGISDGAEFYAPKDYVFKDKVTIKGIRDNAERLSRTRFRQIQFEGIKSILKRGNDPYVDVKTIIKNNSRQYNKGEIGPGGWVIPYRLPHSDGDR